MSDPEIVLMALVGTVGIVCSLTVYAMTTEKDFTYMGGSFFLFLGGMVVLGLFNMIFRTDLASAILVVGGCILEGFYLIYDV